MHITDTHSVAGVPVLGLCLGAQMLSAALGGRVFLSPKPEVGFPIIRLTAEGESHPLLATVTDAFAPTEGAPHARISLD